MLQDASPDNLLSQPRGTHPELNGVRAKVSSCFRVHEERLDSSQSADQSLVRQ